MDTRGILTEQSRQLAAISPLSKTEGKTVDYIPPGSSIVEPSAGGGIANLLSKNSIAPVAKAASSVGKVIN